MSAHTPGPWNVNPISQGAVWAGDVQVAACRVVDDQGNDMVYMEHNDERVRANARLIAAAPRMLALLKRVFTEGDRHFDTCDFVKFDTARYACNCGNQEARAILRDVEGESNG